MKISSSYPYPVLHEENDDYTDSSFDVEYIVENVFGELKIKADLKLNNPGIQQLIDSGQATFLVHIECPRTSFRQAIKTDEYQFEINISNSRLSGLVELHSFVIANQKIEDYENIRLNSWYQGMNIQFEKGNFLAIGNAIEVSLNEDNTEMMNLPSIVNIRRGIKQEFMEVEYYQDNIVIVLPSKEYDYYATYANHMLKNNILSLIVMPALVQVLNQLKYGDGFEEYTWYQVLERIFKENNLNIEDVGTDTLPAIKAAQMILRKPINKSFEEIQKISEMG
uniref:hypothetical protein n=1 Tax=uncultured Allobacillus sp. TaxID=1638025 RepID=UPI00259393EF|nr:hypothetical protein [uncultured Allobacillus sp.]